ncbi:MAG: hypothetical protein [Microviridae sp.]|nr:MAG: hypothetical protein [Microviridae sp.]
MLLRRLWSICSFRRMRRSSLCVSPLLCVRSLIILRLSLLPLLLIPGMWIRWFLGGSRRLSRSPRRRRRPLLLPLQPRRLPPLQRALKPRDSTFHLM